jgi:hypothetical protein
MAENTSGMIIIIFACMGSGGAGLSLVCTNMETAIKTGKINNGSGAAAEVR